MTQRKKDSTNSRPHDRRSGRDRRLVDKGSPTGRERRVTLEPRKPEISEIDVTASEWDALSEQVRPEPKTE
ncbi:hypothetical protein [uncultured Piscinibacter sp.]|uniref:hypothetical protein n=1 Tax=uncultured Piscinibacter sp. TaxID=1131835 RepID=UPI00260FEC84|nr:hypothetical protein [uncultured Piscinibacter sp.]